MAALPPIPLELGKALGLDAVQVLWEHQAATLFPVTESMHWYTRVLPSLASKQVEMEAWQEEKLDEWEAKGLARSREMVKELEDGPWAKLARAATERADRTEALFNQAMEQCDKNIKTIGELEGELEEKDEQVEQLERQLAEAKAQVVALQGVIRSQMVGSGP